MCLMFPCGGTRHCAAPQRREHTDQPPSTNHILTNGQPMDNQGFSI